MKLIAHSGHCALGVVTIQRIVILTEVVFLPCCGRMEEQSGRIFCLLYNQPEGQFGLLPKIKGLGVALATRLAGAAKNPFFYMYLWLGMRTKVTGI